jgi:hypothetical protein
VYAEGEKVGVSLSNRVAWAKTKPGTAKMWRDVSLSARVYRAKSSEQRTADADRFFEEDPETGE